MVISRTDSIGDVMLTLPMAGWLKHAYPACRILFLGTDYTADVVRVCSHVDEFASYSAMMRLSQKERIKLARSWKADVFVHVLPRGNLAMLARRAGVRLRIGTASRWYHWFTCNRLVKLKRKISDLHEAQLNLRLLAPLGAPRTFALDTVGALTGFTRIPELPPRLAALIDPARVNVVLHPGSRGSGVEWGLANFSQLVLRMRAGKHKVFVTGTEKEKKWMAGFLASHPDLTSLCGELTLGQLVAFIARADVLVAASTGPLHIAAAAGTRAIGVYSARRPIFPRRWAPLGTDAHALVHDPFCSACRNGGRCACVQLIAPEKVMELIER